MSSSSMYSPPSNQANNSGSYNNDRPPSAGEAEVATDPASGGFFHSDYKKYVLYKISKCKTQGLISSLYFRHDDLKQMLDSNKDSLKLEAMKRIIGVS
jgi:AP-3 complex subunit beta